jgi:CRP/FNR family transcriptional regulator, cyclic AMP receptor protein
MVDPDIFNDVPLFALLDADERKVLAHQVSARNFAQGETIFRVGEPGSYAYLIQRGKVNVCITDLADEVIVVEVAEAGGLLGMSSLLAHANHLTTATAVEDTSAIEIDRGDISTLLQQRPLAGLDMMTMIETQLRATQELMRTRVSRNLNVEMAEAATLGDRLADAVAKFGGSWKFVSSFGVVMVIYALINILIQKPWDPYPFILLNLFLSMLAAIQAPVIMMSQNRQDTKDRMRSELDYNVNLKAELEIGEILRRVNAIEQKLGAAQAGAKRL